MAKVELKKPVVDEIAANIDGAQAVVLVNYCGLTVEEDTRLRKTLRENDIIYKVYKNTMMNFAFKDTPCEALSAQLEGTNAIAISKNDATAPARFIADFSKETKKMEIKGGVIEGNYYDAAGMQEIAKIPSREVLLGRLLGSMQSPIANLARVLDQIAEKQAGGSEAPAEEAAEAPAAEAPAEA